MERCQSLLNSDQSVDQFGRSPIERQLAAPKRQTRREL
jgi:hypothetical protein